MKKKIHNQLIEEIEQEARKYFNDALPPHDWGQGIQEDEAHSPLDQHRSWRSCG